MEQEALLSSTQRNQRVVKHVKLHSLTMTKPDITYRNANNHLLLGQDTETDEELTLMSCGMNLRSLR